MKAKKAEVNNFQKYVSKFYKMKYYANNDLK